MNIKKPLKTLLAMATVILISGTTEARQSDPPFLRYINHPWVDSLLKTLTIDQQIAQSLWISVWSDSCIEKEVEASDIIRKYGIGGIIFFQGTAEKQAELTNYYQKISRIPLLIAMDAECGAGMRLSNVEKFPFQMTLGAIKNDSLIYRLGEAIAGQFKRLGMHINLAPVVDININPNNPVINYRSFGENRENVSGKTIMYISGMQDNGVIALGKHFPGHGDTRYFQPGVADSMALEAGNDVIEYVKDVEAAIKETKAFITLKKISADDIALKCRKILALKYWSGLNSINTICRGNIENDLSPSANKALIYNLYANAITVLNNNQNILPVKNLQNIRIATLAINRDKITCYQARVAKYHPADHFIINPSDTSGTDKLLKKLAGYDLVIAGVYGPDKRPDMDFGIRTGLVEFLDKLIERNKTIITWFGNPYGIGRIKSLKNTDGLVLAYQDNNYTEDLSAQLIFGGIGACGALPVTINEKWPSGFGIDTPGNLRLKYGMAENAGLISELLERKIDSLATSGLKAKAYPGCEIMVARKGTVVFEKCYGFRTYDNRTPVTEDDLFDLSSITKISASLPGFMLLDTEGKFSPDKTLGNYLPYFKHSNKADISLRDLFTHQGGFTPFIMFWKETMRKDGKYKKRIYRSEYSEKYALEVAHGIYINKNYRKKMFSEIKKSPIGEKKYVYSDLSFIITPEIIERSTGNKWYDFVSDNIYKKIGAFDIVFNPDQKYPLARIIPTEYDSLFRKQQLIGTVHDETAAMLGGISGHAGLFSTANDLMKLMELYRRMGEYGGEQLIGREVMQEYTSVQFPGNKNRRGLGFDKPYLNNDELPQCETYPTKSVSPSSFGHSGYTGTFVWIDPEHEITYIFLSNRVYPTRYNNILSDLNIRTEILQAIYDSIKE